MDISIYKNIDTYNDINIDNYTYKYMDKNTYITKYIYESIFLVIHNSMVISICI